MNRIPLLTALMVFLACACAKDTGMPRAGTAARGDSAVSSSAFVPGQLTVFLDEETTRTVENGGGVQATRACSSDMASALDELGVVSMERVFPVDEEFEDRHREFGLHRWYRVHYVGAALPTAAAERLGLVPGVQNARPVNKLRIDAETFFNDPLEKNQWHYHNSSPSWADVNIVPVWQKYTTGSSKVIVAVVDSGIDFNHEDLADAVVPPGDNGSRSFMLENSGYRIVPESHGTHVAGTIGAINNNGKGVSGIAGGDAKAGKAGVRLMSCQIFQNGLSGANNAAAIVWAADHGAVICNNSWGYHFEDDKGNYDKAAAESTHFFYLQPNKGAYRDDIKDAIDYFNTHAGKDKSGRQTGPMAGGLVCFAAGNDGRTYGPPACYPGCLSVGAITSYGTRSTFSNYGDWVDICAPGVSITSTVPNNGYAVMDGTSMACPHVAGVAALVVSYCGGEGFTRDMLWEKMVGGANSADVPASYRIGPLADALGAIVYGSGDPPGKVPQSEITNVKSNIVTVSVKVPADRDGQPAYGFRLLAASSREELDASNPRSPSASVHYGDFLSRDAGVGDTVPGTIGDLDFNSGYYLAVSAFDYGRNFSELSYVGFVTTGSNHAPVIASKYSGDFKFHVHDRFTIAFDISDEDGHVVNVQFEKDEKDTGALRLIESQRSGEYLLQVLGIASEAGTYHAVLRASDNYGLSAEYPIDYEVLPNQEPVVLKPMENVILNFVGDSRKIDMEQYIVDPDGETFSYKIQISDNSVVHLSQNNGSVLTLTALADSGLATVTLTATDAGGKSVVTSFKVLVRAAEQEFQAFPNPVVESLYVATGTSYGTAVISLYNSNGARVYSASVQCSAFEPARIDMAKAGPGVYTLVVEYGGKVFKSSIIKK